MKKKVKEVNKKWIVCNMIFPIFPFIRFAGAADGQKRLWQDEHAFHNIRQLHCTRHSATGCHEYVHKTRLKTNRWPNHNRFPIRTIRAQPTVDVEHSHVKFLGNLVLNLWDCGGQESFMEQYFASQKDNIFRNVEVLIYVFDVESRELDNDMHYYQSCLEAIYKNSPDAKIFCLVHKMDLVAEDQREEIFKEREEDLKKLSLPLNCTCFRTSIWDETLYR